MNRREFLLTAAGATVRPPLPDVSWMSVSLEGEGRRQWPGANQAVSMGSLLKPFLAVAYLKSQGRAPSFYCAGSASDCWYARGHGRQTLPGALAQSCNGYFLKLAGELDRAALEETCLLYRLAPPSRDLSPEHLIGLGEGWPQRPNDVAKAFAKLVEERWSTPVRPVLAGMEECALRGTARAAGFACYAKTGTAACSHIKRGEGDGYAVAIYPLEQPRRVLLASCHNTTGAVTAGMLRALQAGAA